MKTILDIIAIFATGLFDRAGGDDDLLWSKNLDRALGGLMVGFIAAGPISALALAETWIHLLVFVAFYTGSMAMAYGVPWGNASSGRVEDIKPMLKRAGAGTGVLAGYYIVAHKFLPGDYMLSYGPLLGMLIGFTVAPYIGKKVFENDYADKFRATKLYKIMDVFNKEQWNTAEMARGWCISGITKLFMVAKSALV